MAIGDANSISSASGASLNYPYYWGQWYPTYRPYVPPPVTYPAVVTYQPARKIKCVEYHEDGTIKRVEYED